MAGLYIEDDTGLRPVLTTVEGQGWEVATGDQAGRPAQEIYYAHTQPDLPGAAVMWGPQLFGTVELRVHFRASDVTHAARRAPVVAALPRLQQKAMEFHESVRRLVGLQERRHELSTRLSRGATRPDPYLRARAGTIVKGLSYTLGKAAPLEEATDLAVAQTVDQWARQLPPAEQRLVLHAARALRGPQAATAAAPLPEAGTAATSARANAIARRADYRPPTDIGTPGAGRGDGLSSQTGSAAVTFVRPSTAFLWRMALMVLGLCTWTGFHCWRGWRLWHAVDWEQEALRHS